MRARRSPDVMTFRRLAAIAAALFAITLSGCAGNAAPGVTIELNGSPAAAQLRAHLPSTLLFDDRMGAAGVAFVSTPLDVDGAGMLTQYRPGDVAYWAAGQSLVVFLNDGEIASVDGLIMVGRISDGMADLADCNQNCPIRLTAHNGAGREEEQ